MRARVINAVGAALLGGAATLAVAWGAAIFDPEQPLTRLVHLPGRTTTAERGQVDYVARRTHWRDRIDLFWWTEIEYRGSIVGRPRRPPHRSSRDAVDLSWPPAWAKGVAMAPLPITTTDQISMLVFTGWPLRCLAGAATLGEAVTVAGAPAVASPSGVMPITRNVYTSAAVLLGGEPAMDRQSFLSKRLIPLHLLWGAFALNALLFALMFAMPYEVVRVFRHFRRRRRAARDMCPACGYALIGASDGVACPECGAVRPPR